MNKIILCILFLCIFSVSLSALPSEDCCEHRTLENEVFYFVVTDRFANGDLKNDRGGLSGNSDVHGFDPTRIRHYHGGDLQGIIDQLPYLEDLGITALWLTPLFKNIPVAQGAASYHGYWIVDFTQVDPHLGNSAQLKALIAAAHKRNIKVFLDIVINHTADVVRYRECHDESGAHKPEFKGKLCPYRSLAVSDNDAYTPFIPAGNEELKTPQWLNSLDYYHHQGDSTFEGESSTNGDFFGLDDVNTEHPDVVSGMIEIYKFWMREYRIDGFRIDTTKHVNLAFWQQWVPAIKHEARELGLDNFFVFGEVYDGNPQVLSTYTTQGKLDSVLDFGLYFAIRKIVAENQGSKVLAELFAQDGLYTDKDSSALQLMTFAGNHDAGRLSTFIKRANPKADDAELLQRLKLANSMLLFLRGIPVLYYGDEQGFVGDGDDAEAREDMMPSKVPEYNDNDLIGTKQTTADNNFVQSHPLFKDIREKILLLKKFPGLNRAEQTLVASSDEPGIFAISRRPVQGEGEFLIVFNTSVEAKTASLQVRAKNYKMVYPVPEMAVSQQVASKQLSFIMPPFSAKVFLAGK